MTALRAAVDYPRSDAEFQAWFGTDAILSRLPGVVALAQRVRLSEMRLRRRPADRDGPFKCKLCGARTSVTAGTLFDRRRTPLTVRFAAVWMFVTQKDGVSALSLAGSLEIGSIKQPGRSAPISLRGSCDLAENG